jgi:hypothetical protein
MALINCCECGKQISNRAEACIGCGAPINKFDGNKSGGLVNVEKGFEHDSANLDGKLEIPHNVIPNSNHISSLVSEKSEDNVSAVIEEKPSFPLADAETPVIQFDKSDPNYKSIKITIVVLYVIHQILESGFAVAEGKRAGILAVYLNFLITRGIIRYIYVRNDVFRSCNLFYKIGATVLIWVGVYIVKLMIAVMFLNFAL